MRSAGSASQAASAVRRLPVAGADTDAVIEADKAAIMAVLTAETDAWVRRDFPTLAGYWVQSPQARLMHSSASLGAEIFEGWDAIARRMQRLMEKLPQTYSTGERLQWKRLNIVVNGETAWVTYDQVGADDALELAGVQHELKIFHRVGGAWKIACLVVMHRSVEYASYPLIEVNAEGQVLWLNQQARERIKDHPGLLIAAGKLRTRHHSRDSALRDALDWAWRQAHDHLVSNHTQRPVSAVHLGRDDDEVPLFCWVVVHDAKSLVTFDNAEMVGRRLDAAETLFGLSPAQARLARLVVDGKDLSEASGILGIGVTTARTHLQRIFERTGVHNQTALVRVLLSAEAPGD